MTACRAPGRGPARQMHRVIVWRKDDDGQWRVAREAPVPKSKQARISTSKSPAAMPKIDLAAIPVRIGAGYPKPFDEACAGRTRQRLGDAGQLQDFSVNLMTLPPGRWSSQRHWHSHEDEFVYVLEGELTLVEDGGPVLLRAGDCACFPKGTGNGHHLRNDSSVLAVYLEVGSRQPDDLTTCSDIDLMSSNRDGAFMHKDGTPYAE